MKDLHSSLAIALIVGPIVMNGTPAVASVDLQDHKSAEIILGIGIGGITFDGTNKIEFIVEHSDDDSVYSAVTDDEMLGITGITGGIVKSLVAAHATAASYRFGYIGGKRYVKVTPTFGGTHGTGTPLYCAVVQGHGRENPQADQA